MKRPKTKLPADAYDRTPRFTITVTDESCWLTRHDMKGRPATTYPVNLADLGAAFNAFEASTGFMPEGVLYWQRKSQSERIAIWLPPARREIAWRSGKRVQHLDVPLPGFVFIGEGTRYWIFAASQRPASNSAVMCKAPLPNVHEDGLICAGNVEFPRCSLSTIHQAAALFFASEFNHDLSSDKITPARPHPISRNDVSTREESLFNFYRGLAGQKRFPMQRLQQMLRSLADALGANNQRVVRSVGGDEVYEDEIDYPGLMEDEA